MQWVDLRGLSSLTRRVARLNTIATRRQLPLLLPSLLIRAALPPRCLRNEIRAFSDPGLPRANQSKNIKPEKKQNAASIFEEVFPDEDVSTFPYTRRPNLQQQSHEDDAQDDVKVRYLTSIGDKSEVTEWKARQKEAQEAANQKQPAKPGKLGKKEKNMGNESPEFFETKPWVSQIPTLPGQQPPADASSGSSEQAGEAAATTDEDSDSGGSSSLFEELAGEQPVKKLTVKHNDMQAWVDSHPKDNGNTLSQGNDKSGEEKTWPAMLILSNASANLLENDFFRVGPRGQHLDGWTASITKIMQAYDYNTLEPLGRYFLLFDSYVAAADYQREAQRLHSLARRSLQTLTPFVTQSGTQTDAQSFTLAVPSNAPLSLHLYRLNKATQDRLETFSMQGLLSITPDLPPRADSQVVLSLEGGATTDQRTLSRWIKRDARDRNLGWPVQHLRPYFPPKTDRRRLSSVEPGDGHQEEPELGQYGDDAAPALVQPGDQESAKGPADETVRSGRFVLSFPDVHEARRFVRAWHRKEIVQARGQSVLVNTHVVW